MNNQFKDIDIKNRAYYFFNDIINIKHFDPNNVKINEKSYKNILVYYIGYVTIEKLIVLILYALFSAKLMDTLKKLMEISI